MVRVACVQWERRWANKESFKNLNNFITVPLNLTLVSFCMFKPISKSFLDSYKLLSKIVLYMQFLSDISGRRDLC